MDCSQSADENVVKPKIYLTASRGRRFFNYFIDIICIYLVMIFSGFFMGFLFAFLNITVYIDDIQMYLFSFAMIFFYYLFFEALFQKTPGKFITRTHVIREDSSKPDFKALIIRTLCRFIPFEPLSFFSDYEAIGLHDRFSKTRVIMDKIGITIKE